MRDALGLLESRALYDGPERPVFTRVAELGNALTASFLGASPLHPDASLQRYVNRVGKWVALPKAGPGSGEAADSA